MGGQPLAITICEDAWNDKGFWPRQMYPVDPVEGLDGAVGVAAEGAGRAAADHSEYFGFAVLAGEAAGAAGDAGGDGGAAWGVCGDGEPGGRQRQPDLRWVVAGDCGRMERWWRGRLRLPRTWWCFDTEDAARRLPRTAACRMRSRQLWDALVLGTRDYVRKCGFSKVLVGLSGGIDSALVAAIAVEALGAENVVGVGMPSEYSSLGSIEDARKLAKNLGMRFELLPIHDVFAQFQHVLQPLFAGTPFGLAEENLQPRIRGTLLMALSNKFGALVLTTGNKSEMATGYCTLYGDMVGALAVIGDVMKTRVYALSRYVNREREVIPWATIEKPPSAELRPEQKDTDSLPPYEVLDPILEAYVERYCSAEQIAEEQGVDVGLVRSVLQLVERSEYKRQQAAPVLKVTRKSFGMGRRFPIAVKVQV